jgi:hypothetical protein
MKTTFKNNYRRNPAVAGRGLAKLKKLFQENGLPFVYGKEGIIKEEGEKQKNHPYDIYPKGVLNEEKRKLENYAKIRMALAKSKEKEYKVRQDIINKSKYKGASRFFKDFYVLFDKTEKSQKHQKVQSKSSSRQIIPASLTGVARNKSVSRRGREVTKFLMDQGYIPKDFIDKSKQKKELPNELGKEKKKKKKTEENEDDDKVKNNTYKDFSPKI